MNASDLDRLMAQAARKPPENLPPGFSTQVVRRARWVHETARAHWRLLTLATIMALLLSMTIALKIGSTRSDSGPPSMEIFQPGAPANPFAAP